MQGAGQGCHQDMLTEPGWSWAGWGQELISFPGKVGEGFPEDTCTRPLKEAFPGHLEEEEGAGEWLEGWKA